MSRAVGSFRVVILAVLVAAAWPALAAAGVLQLTKNNVAETGTDAALDVAGNVHVVYERDATIYYRGKTSSGWSAEEAVAAGTNPAVGAGASGVPQVVFLSGGGLWFTARIGAPWLAPVQFGVGSSVDMAVDGNDVAHVVYLGNTDTNGDSASYTDLNYTSNAGGVFPASPIRTWSSWYYYDGWGRAANYYFDFAPIIAVDGVGNYAITYSFRWINGGGGWNDWGTSVHVYRSGPDVDLSNADLYKGYYPAPRRNGLTLAGTGTASLAYGTMLVTAAGAWSEDSLLTGSSHTLDLSASGLQVAYVTDTGGIAHVEFTESGPPSTPLLLDPTTTGRNPVVLGLDTGAIVVYEAVDSVDHEVWFAKTVNEAPVLASIGDRTGAEGSLLTFTISATDGDGDPLTYEASNLPSGAAFDAETGAFSWTPGYDQEGTYADIVFTVSDGVDTDSETISITVDHVNAPPILDAIGPLSVNEGATLSLTVSATDEDGDTLTYGATNLPSGATFDTGTGAFSWTPGYDQAGDHADVVFSATDGEKGDSETITITVVNVNRTPVLAAVGNRSVDEAATLTFTVSATDEDGDTLTYSASGLPAGATFAAGTRTFSFTPGYEDAGSYPGVTFSVTDGEDTDSEAITLTVDDVNRAPVLAAIGNRSVDERSTLSFTLSATDEDGDILTYAASNLPSGATFDPDTRAFEWTPEYDQAGAHAGIVFTVTDHGTPSRDDSETITITVGNVNRAPVLGAVGEKTVNEASTLTFTVSATDEDGDTLTYGASNLPAGAAFDPATRTFSWTPGFAQAATYEGVVFTVSDGTDTDSESISIKVYNVNRPPVLAAIGDRSVGERATLSFTLSATDADGETLGYTTSELPTGATFDADTRTFSWTPAQGQAGTYAGLVFSVTDGIDTDAETITITVRKSGPTDFNGDGQADILWHHQTTGELYTWMLDGTVTTGGSYLTPKSFADTKWQIRGLADFSGDGKVDVLWHHQATGDLYVWTLDGTVTSGGSYLTPKSFADTQWQIRAVGDFDGDGKPDILWHHQATGELYVWFMNGFAVKGGSYLTPRSFADTKWQIRGLADFSGDGKPDLLWHHQTTGELYVWTLDGTVTVGGSYLTPKAFADTSWKIVKVSDFDGDGKPDLLWQNQLSGDLYVWFLDGTVVTRGSYLTPKGFTDRSWKVVPQ